MIMTNNNVLISLENVSHHFNNGSECVTVLKDISLQINKGEFVAIVGPSGSGKSTLMNLIGCLDRPSIGELIIRNKPIQSLDVEQGALFRSQHIGFIFQRYHLLPYLTALENVAIPANYTSMPAELRQERAAKLLERLGLHDRKNFKPNQLSGGQQQRVSIARALMNNAEILLADEPTGALDSTNSREVMDVLHALNQAGHTVIIVTHDLSIARQAQRIITLHDGQIIKDTKKPSKITVQNRAVLAPDSEKQHINFWQSIIDATRTAFRSLIGHRIRTLLSMLGIIIGIASVVSSIAIGEGAHQSVLKEISQLDGRSIEIRPGLGWNNPRKDLERALTPQDLSMLNKLPMVENASPVMSSSSPIRRNDKDISSVLYGVNYDFLHKQVFEYGQSFNINNQNERDAVVILESELSNSLFDKEENPIGKIIQLSGVPFKVIGVIKSNESRLSSASLKAWVPFTTYIERLNGDVPFQSIQVRIVEKHDLEHARKKIEARLEQQHGQRDFFTLTDESTADMIKSVSRSITLLTTVISAISLLVGGVGVMNIMLVSVTERIHEIGIRLSVGARPSDIQRQFLIEAIVICLLGGVTGIIISILVGFIFPLFTHQFQMVFTFPPIFMAFTFSAFVGLVFGFFPAKNAARLKPVTALAHQ